MRTWLHPKGLLLRQSVGVETGVTLLVGVAIPVFVGWSRAYRGMHHFSDVVAGVLLGVGVLVVLVFAARAARAATERRDGTAVGGESA